MGYRASVALTVRPGRSAGKDRLPSTAQWVRALQDVWEACAAADEHEQDGILRDIWNLLAQSPMRLNGLVLPDPAWFGSTLGENCYESAALAMLGEEAGFMLSRGARGRYIATLLLPAARQEVTADGSALAMALTAAIALAMIGSAAVRDTPLSTQ